MASIDAVSYDQPAYNPGDAVNLTIDYTPDSPSVVPTPVDVTIVLNDANGNQLALLSRVVRSFPHAPSCPRAVRLRGRDDHRAPAVLQGRAAGAPAGETGGPGRA